MEQIQKFSAELQVTPDTPQAFIALTSDDPSVAPYHGVNYYLALQKNKVPATLHVYPTGGHGWGFQDHFKYKQQWTQELEKWLRDGVVFPENPEPMLRIGKSYLGTKYVANTLDQDGGKSDKCLWSIGRYLQFGGKQGSGNSPCLSYRRTWLGISGSF